jgi:hypothetical protein
MAKKITVRSLFIIYKCECGTKEIKEEYLGEHFKQFIKKYPNKICGNCTLEIVPKYSFKDEKIIEEPYNGAGR